MKFKKIIPLLLITMLAGFITPVFAADDSPVGAEKTAKDVRSQELTNRLIEIRDMDKSNLTSSEKRELRKEVKEIRKAHSEPWNLFVNWCHHNYNITIDTSVRLNLSIKENARHHRVFSFILPFTRLGNYL